MKKITKSQVLKKLEGVVDPELGVSIVDMGLVYGVDIKGNKIKVTMTFTTPACPLLYMIASQVESKAKELGFKDVHVHVTWDPPWTADRMSKKAKAILGI
jgi:metal-sulfur cluster biosynthetic enzyme